MYKQNILKEQRYNGILVFIAMNKRYTNILESQKKTNIEHNTVPQSLS